MQQEQKMRNNQPVTQKEIEFDHDVRLVSMTDLQGDITFVNQDFVRVSEIEKMAGQVGKLLQRQIASM